MVILPGLLDEEIGQELRDFASLLAVIGLNSEFKVILLGMELGSVNGVLPAFHSSDEGVTEIILGIGNSIIELVKGRVLNVSLIQNAPVVVIIVRSLVLRVHLEIEGNSSKHSRRVRSIIKSSSNTSLIINGGKDIINHISNNRVDEFKS